MAFFCWHFHCDTIQHRSDSSCGIVVEGRGSRPPVYLLGVLLPINSNHCSIYYHQCLLICNPTQITYSPWLLWTFASSTSHFIPLYYVKTSTNGHEKNDCMAACSSSSIQLSTSNTTAVLLLLSLFWSDKHLRVGVPNDYDLDLALRQRVCQWLSYYLFVLDLQSNKTPAPQVMRGENENVLLDKQQPIGGRISPTHQQRQMHNIHW